MRAHTADTPDLETSYTGGITPELELGSASKATCLDCGQAKPREEFNDSRHTKRGHRAYCKACSLARVRISRGVAREDAYLTPAPDQTCEICGGIGQARGLFLDHDHRTGRFRGWLCSGCNTAIARFADSTDLLDAAAMYLTRAGATNRVAARGTSWS